MTRAFIWQRMAVVALTLAALAFVLYTLGAPGYVGG